MAESRIMAESVLRARVVVDTILKSLPLVPVCPEWIHIDGLEVAKLSDSLLHPLGP